MRAEGAAFYSCSPSGNGVCYEPEICIDHRCIPRDRQSLRTCICQKSFSCISQLPAFSDALQQKKKSLTNTVPAHCSQEMRGNPDDVRKMFAIIESICPGLDVLVNNAGISFVGLLQDMSDAQWSEILNTNLSSVFYCCRSAIGHMVSQKSGKIINISSMWGTVGASCEAAYSATKSGMNGLTKALAKELAPSNVQVNAIACGVIDTAMNAQFSEEEREALREEIPAGRFADSEEVAALALTLASGHSYLTGQIIGLDGGYI